MRIQSTSSCGYVYILGSKEFGWYKIGKSRTPSIRVATLGVLLPFRVEVLALWFARDCGALESELHNQHSKHQINGEWFNFDDRSLACIVDNPKLLSARRDPLTSFSNLTTDVVRGVTVEVAARKKRDAEDKWWRELVQLAVARGIDPTRRNLLPLQKELRRLRRNAKRSEVTFDMAAKVV